VGRRLILGVGVVAALLLVPVASSSAAECDWEWGGVVEDPPQPCLTPVPVTESNPLTLEDPLPVAEVSPVVVPETFSGTAELDESGEFASAIYLGLALIVFLLAVHVVSKLRSRT